MSRYCITIEKGDCIGYGRCVDLAPGLFELENGVAGTVVAETDDPAALDAAAECPMGAITVEEVRAA